MDTLPEYRLYTLGWRAFQDLCGTVLREVLGQTVQAFADSNDGGRDGAFHGTWNPAGEPKASLSGRLVVQCKFSNKESSSISLGNLTDEIEKAENLVAQGSCDSYILMTNCRVSGVADAKISGAFRNVGVKNVLILGSEWINITISTSSSLRRHVPRIYGLGDLSSILDERNYDQARILLEFLGNDLGTFVPTNSYHQSVSALERHGIVLLLGEPASGKSVIAATLAVTAMHEWKCAVQKPESSNELVRGWNVNESNQFFWLDDAFGALRHDPALTQEWVRNVSKIRAAVSQGSKIVLTSRDYIYKEAWDHLKEDAFPQLVDGRVVIDLGVLSVGERSRILYNHIKMGTQAQSFKEAIRPWLPSLANSSQFKPEMARRLGLKEFTKGLAVSQPSVINFMEKNPPYLNSVLRQLSDHQRAALALVYMAPSGLESPIMLDTKLRTALDRLGSDIGSCRIALEAMDGTFVRHSWFGNGSQWVFWHPTIREAFAQLISESPELLGVFVEGLTPSRVVQRLNCGGESRSYGRGRMVEIPSGLYRAVIEKLQGYRPGGNSSARWDSELIRYVDFLYNYTSDEFLSMLVVADGEIVERIIYAMWSPYEYSAAAKLIARIHSIDHLNENCRLKFLGRMVDSSVVEPDSSWLSDRFRSIFTPAEIEAIGNKVRDELGPSLEGFVNEWNDEWDPEQEPSDHYGPYQRALDDYAAYFAEVGDAVMSDEFLEAAGLVEHFEEAAVKRHSPPWDQDDDRYPGSFATPVAGRSIFDDVHL
ncbi:restriction endonuclease [Rhodococcus oryzae]|uniref:nSTAND3 domain-containing NTPase n=1 Tax=Rhodococcus oryzae TaxID=2571143 RepID=UPI00378DC02D